MIQKRVNANKISSSGGAFLAATIQPESTADMLFDTGADLSNSLGGVGVEGRGEPKMLGAPTSVLDIDDVDCFICESEDSFEYSRILCMLDQNKIGDVERRNGAA